MTDSNLKRSLLNYGTLLREEDLDRAFLRDTELRAALRAVDREHDRSIVLVGPSGIGKTAILHELFRSLLKRRPGWTILQTSTTQLMAGTKYLGEWQTRLDGLARTALLRERVLIYLTDIQNLPNAGRSDKNDNNMADALAPHLERNAILLVGECSDDAYGSALQSGGSLGKCLTPIRVEPPPREQIPEIIRLKLATLTANEPEEPLEVANETLETIQRLGSIYFPGQAPPGGALQLLEEVIDYRRERELPEPQAADGLPRNVVEHGDIIQALVQLTGIPDQLLDDSLPLNLPEVRKFIGSRVIGQEASVSAIVDVITLIKAGLTDPKKPLSVMLFVGPTGVGKTELAKTLAEFIFGSADRMLRFDMSEFKDFHSFEKLIGANAEESGSLLSQVRQKPFSVILLDEIEKAHGNIFDLLLQVFDDGRLSDASGQTTNFTQTLIIMTSNLGGDLNQSPGVGFRAEADSLADNTNTAVQGFFRPEFLNRIDHILQFQPLRREHMRILAQRELGQVLLRSGVTRRGLRVDVDPAVIDVLATAGFSQHYGARPLKRAVERLALLPVARKIVSMSEDDRQSLLRLTARNGKISVTQVNDRQAARSRRIARGVEVEDPVKGGRRRLKPEQIEQDLERLGVLAGELQQVVADQQLAANKARLVELSGAVDFWDEPAHARETLSQIYRTERLIEAVKRVGEAHQDLGMRYQTARKESDPTSVQQTAQQLRLTLQHAELVRYSLQCTEREDRNDAFVALNLVGDPADEDVVAKLLGMYSHWAQSKGFETQLIHEEPEVQGGFVRSAVLQIEGVSVYGILRDEDGMHEISYRKGGGDATHNHFIRVRVLPVLEEPPASHSRMTVRTERFRQTSLLNSKPIRWRSTATLAKVSRSAQVCSALGQAEAERSVRDLLLGEIWWEEHNDSLAEPNLTPAAPGATHRLTEGFARQYILAAKSKVRDPRTDVTVTRINHVWKGEIDEFLNASLAQRQLPPPAASNGPDG